MPNHKIKFNSLYKRLVGLQEAYAACPIVSVGSGVGEWEKRLEAKGVPVICVDPAPNSFDDRKVFKAPEYGTVADLIAARSEVVGNCILLLIWASPNDSKYDIEAVRDLKPRVVVALYGSDGAAGGEQFRRWVALLGGPAVLKSEMEEKYDNPAGYQVGACLELRYWRQILGDRDVRNDCLVVLFDASSEETRQKFITTFGREMYGDAQDVDLDTAVMECMKKKLQSGLGLLKMLLADAIIRSKNLS